MMQPQGKGEELVLCWEVWFMSRTQLVFTWVLFFWLFLTIDVFGSLDDGLNAFLSRLCFHLPKLRETKLPRLSCANPGILPEANIPTLNCKSFLIYEK